MSLGEWEHRPQPKLTSQPQYKDRSPPPVAGDSDSGVWTSFTVTSNTKTATHEEPNPLWIQAAAETGSYKRNTFELYVDDAQKCELIIYSILRDVSS